MKHRLCLVFVFAFLFVVSARADQLDDYINAEMKKRQIPGIAIAVIKDGKVVREAGYGYANLEHKIPVTKDTVFEIGSISKQFAAEAVMLLVEDGKLNLDDPINKYLSANAPKTWEKLTIRHLLNHTSGLKDWTEVNKFSYRREYTAEEFIDLVREFPLGFEPGSSWLYSNTNLPLIGVIVERAAGKPYEDFVAERIFKPLGFPTIRFRRQEEIVPNRATGYVLRDGTWKNGEPFRPHIIAPSGGVLASATDLARWWDAALTGKVVKPASLEQMIAPARLTDGRLVNHGFAFFSDSFMGHKFIQHAGSTVGGFGTMIRHYPKEKVTVAVAGNLEDGGFGPDTIIKRVSNIYIPGVFAGGLKEVKDDAKREMLLNLLRAVADGKDSPMIGEKLRPRISATFKEQLAANLKAMKSSHYLGSETIGPDHFVLDQFKEAFFVRLVTAEKTTNYGMRTDKDGKVVLVFAEQ
jgi:CubicO group peptidase (beta-lactamase class C family)